MGLLPDDFVAGSAVVSVIALLGLLLVLWVLSRFKK